ncbi:beta strand repeat-containing protein, partial [Nocardioides zeicaulis]|uniref:beta strand repeat-containing protein n=1 Tax=Nocardioides zeicaulis TaxID=1776857 RepID=UPI0039EE2E41
NYASNNVTILTRGADGTYTSTIAGTTGASPVSLAIGDLDGDGDQDLATANLGSNNVTVLTRGAAGTYTRTVAGATGSSPISLAIGDLDGDGDQDLATANLSSNNVTVLTRGAAGTYTSAIAGTTGATPVSVAIGDLDGDGDQDLATANVTSNNVTILTAGRDEATPTTTDNVPTGPRNAPVPVTLTADDTGGSGIREIRYAVGTAPGTPTTLYNPACKPTLGNGESIRYFAVDNAGNAETAHTSIAAQVDTTRPTVTLSAPTGPVGGPFTVTATFSEAVTGLDASDFTIGNGTAGTLTGSGATYTLSVTPATDGTVTVDLPAGSATDAATNTNTAAAQLTRTADLTRPSVTLSAPAGPSNGPFTVTATFSEAVTGLDASDFAIGNGTAGTLTGSGATYTLPVTPATDGTVTVDLPAGSATDTTANPNTAATQLTRTADLTRPSVTLSAPAGPVGGPFTVTATFSEAVTGLDASDFAIGNGTAGTLTGSGATYTLPVTPATDDTVTIDLPAGSATDTAANPNTAATQLTRTVAQPTFSTGPDATVTGTPVVGGTLAADTGTTVPPAESFTYAWSADGTPIAGATASTLTLDASQLAKTITVAVTATRTGYDDATDTSVATSPVGAGTFNPTPAAAVTGTAHVGQTLTATTGAPVPSPDSYAYTWYADDVAVAGQTGPQLTLTSALAHRRISVEVTARRAGYTDAVSRSTATDPVAADLAPQLTLDVSAATTAGRATDGTAAVRRGTRITITWSATEGATVTATGELGEILARRYPHGPLPTSGQVTRKLKRTGLHRFRMQATGPGGSTGAYAAMTVVRGPTRLRVEAPAVARSDQRVALRVTGLGGHERYTIILTRAGTRTPIVSAITGRANRAGVIHRRLLLPDLAAGKRRVTVTVTGRTTRRTGNTTIRLR